MKKIAVLVLCLVGIGVFAGFSGDVFAENEAAKFDDNTLFPSWGKEEGGALNGIVGVNEDKKFLVNYLPALINIFLKFVSPAILVVLIIAGVKMIIAGDDSEQVEKSKKVIMYSVTGVIIILLSYSIMRAVYFFFVGD